MGKGKGSVEWVAQIQPGRVLYEIEGVSKLAREAFELAAQKMPCPPPCETDSDVMKAQEIREKSAGSSRAAPRAPPRAV